MLVGVFFSVVTLSSVSASAMEIQVAGIYEKPFSIAFDGSGVPRIVGKKNSIASLKTLAEAATDWTSSKGKRFCYFEEDSFGTDVLGNLKTLVLALADAKDSKGNATAELISLSVQKKNRSISLSANVYDVEGNQDQVLKFTFEDCPASGLGDRH